jgi:hypothetical protein
MTINSHPQCQKPDDCRVYRQGERVCWTCDHSPMRMSDSERKLYKRARGQFGTTRAKRILIEDRTG